VKSFASLLCKKATTTIKDLPNEIIQMIFDILLKEKDSYTAMCLGLTSRQYYPMFKKLYPPPIQNMPRAELDPQFRHVTVLYNAFLTSSCGRNIIQEVLMTTFFLIEKHMGFIILGRRKRYYRTDGKATDMRKLW
jgi:hypothetical protein